MYEMQESESTFMTCRSHLARKQCESEGCKDELEDLPNHRCISMCNFKMKILPSCLSPCLFNFFMGVILKEIRRRHEEIGAGIRARYNMNCNPLERSDGKIEDTSREGGGELTMYDLLFADDSVFFTKGGKAKSMEMSEIVTK